MVNATNRRKAWLGDLTVPVVLGFDPSHLDSYRLEATLADSPALTLSSTRRFSYHDAATAAVSCSAEGPALELTSNRQLGDSTNAEFALAMSSLAEQSLSLSCSHERERYSVKGKLQVRWPRLALQ